MAHMMKEHLEVVEDFDKWSEQETNCSDIWTYCFEKKTLIDN